MNMITSTIMTYLTLSNLKEQSPMKMITTILISITVLMILMRMKNSSWMPLILTMLYLGGILIMFSIISSITPNTAGKKVKKNNMSIMMTLILISMMTMSLPSQMKINLWSSTPGIKAFVGNQMNMMFMIMMIMMFFYSFIYLLSKEKTSMRTWICCKKV